MRLGDEALAGLGGLGGGVKHLARGGEAGARFEDVHDGEADEKGDRGDDLEVEQGLDADSAQLLEIAHRGDAVDDGAEDDGSDHHLDELHEPVAEGFERGAERWTETADEDAQGDRDQDLDVKDAIPGRARCFSHQISPGGYCYSPLLGSQPRKASQISVSTSCRVRPEARLTA